MGDESGYGRSIYGAASRDSEPSYKVAVKRGGLLIEKTGSEASPQPEEHIPWSDLKLAWEDDSRVKVSPKDGTTLYVTDSEALLTRLERYGSAEIRKKVNELWKEESSRRTRSPLYYSGLLIALALLAVFLWRGLTYVEHAIVDYAIPLTLEAELAEQIKPRFTGGRDKAHPKLQKAVQEIAQKLIQAWSKENRLLYSKFLEIEVIDSPVVNAFALPAGKIIVYTGLIARSESPDQLAAVIAHELSHVAHRDGMKRLIAQIKWKLLYAYLAGDLSSDQEFLLQRVESLSGLKYSRRMERRADREALRLLVKSGFEAKAAYQFFEKLQKEQPEILDTLSFLSDHPATPERVEYLKKLYEKLARERSKELAKESTPEKFIFNESWREIRNLAQK